MNHFFLKILLKQNNKFLKLNNMIGHINLHKIMLLTGQNILFMFTLTLLILYKWGEILSHLFVITLTKWCMKKNQQGSKKANAQIFNEALKLLDLIRLLF